MLLPEKGLGENVSVYSNLALIRLKLDELRVTLKPILVRRKGGFSSST